MKTPERRQYFSDVFKGYKKRPLQGGGESNKMNQEENYQDFLKWEGVFLGHSLTFI